MLVYIKPKITYRQAVYLHLHNESLKAVQGQLVGCIGVERHFNS